MIDLSQMDKTFKILLAAMVVLVILVPVGLIATGTAFGEWGPDELQSAVGFVPTGLQQLSDLWTPLLPDYDFPGGHDTLATQAPGYYVSAIVGSVIVGGVAFLIGKAVIKRDDTN